jgi:hypothetical protein
MPKMIAKTLRFSALKNIFLRTQADLSFSTSKSVAGRLSQRLDTLNKNKDFFKDNQLIGMAIAA